MKNTPILVVIASLIILGAGCSANTQKSNIPVTTSGNGAGNGQGNGQGSGAGSGRQNTGAGSSGVTWMQTADGWQANGTPPACPSPVLQAPTNLTTVTSILYPGQTRGGNYKPHGGFRFDTATSNTEQVTAPMAGQVVDGSRYLVNGETQYMFDIIAPCGMMYRLGHLLTLTPKFQAIADQFPSPQEGDSRTTNVNPPVAVTLGEQLATAIGVTVGGRNVFFDFGVYDLRQKNTAAASATYLSAHPSALEQHAVCWFGLLPAADAAKVKALPPGDPTSGKTSDYCR